MLDVGHVILYMFQIVIIFILISVNNNILIDHEKIKISKLKKQIKFLKKKPSF